MVCEISNTPKYRYKEDTTSKVTNFVEYMFKGVVQKLNDNNFEAEIYDPLEKEYGSLVYELKDIEQDKLPFVVEGAEFNFYLLSNIKGENIKRFIFLKSDYEVNVDDFTDEMKKELVYDKIF